MNLITACEPLQAATSNFICIQIVTKLNKKIMAKCKTFEQIGKKTSKLIFFFKFPGDSENSRKKSISRAPKHASAVILKVTCIIFDIFCQFYFAPFCNRSVRKTSSIKPIFNVILMTFIVVINDFHWIFVSLSTFGGDDL